MCFQTLDTSKQHRQTTRAMPQVNKVTIWEMSSPFQLIFALFLKQWLNMFFFFLIATLTTDTRKGHVQPICYPSESSVQYLSVSKNDVPLIWLCLWYCFQFLSALGIFPLPHIHMSLTAPHAVPDARNDMIPKHVTQDDLLFPL